MSDPEISLTEPLGETQTPGTPEAPASPARVLASEYNSNRAFADFPISPEVLKGLTELGYAMATPIQAASIEPALAGKDLVLRAKTGTGKTAAFGIPIVEKVLAGDRRTRAVVLAPTRELALQIAQEVAGIARFKDLRVAAIYGGVGFGPQEQALRDGAEIVVGTPGRMLDHIKRGNLKLGEVSFAVLDEADEMLSMGFLEDVRKILDRTPDTRQTLLCSATIDEGMKSLVARYLKEPEEILLSADGDNVSTVTHILYETSPDYHKARALSDLLEQERPGSAIIFCNTREDVSTVYTYLDRQGFRAEMITGDLPQTRRERVMAKIKAGKVQFLVATDVAARGIDISDLTHVINYSLPDDAAVYLHRIGRTGRIGKTGTAITLAGGADFSTRITLERQHRLKFDVKQLPTTEELGRLRGERLGRVIKEASGSVAYESYVEAARGLKDRPDADVIIATMLKVYFQWEHARRVAEEEEANSPEGAPSERRDEGRDRPRDDRRDRSDRPRDDRRDRNDRSRDDRPREDRPREDRPREDRGERRRDERPRDDRPRDERPPRTEAPERRDVPAEGSVEAAAATESPAVTAAESRPAKRREPRAERRPETAERKELREDKKGRSSAEKKPEPSVDQADGLPVPLPPPSDDADFESEEGGEIEAGGEEGTGAEGTKRRRRRRRRSGPRPDATPAT